MKIKKALSVILGLALLGVTVSGTSVKASSSPSLEITTKAKYDKVSSFSEGLALVHGKDGYSYIGTDGKVKIGPIKNEVFKNKNDEGRITKNTSKVKYASDFHDGIAFLFQDDDCKGSAIAIDKDGKEMFQYEGSMEQSPYSMYFLQNYMNGVATLVTIKESDTIQIMSTNGEISKINMKKITGKFLYEVGEYVVDDLLKFVTEKKEHGKFVFKAGYINVKTKKVVVEDKFDDAGQFYNGIAPVSIGGKYGFINEKGEYVIKPQYENYWMMDLRYERKIFDEGIECVEKDGKWGAIDLNGNVVVDFKYDTGFYFENGMASVEKDGKWGMIDKTGKTLVDCQYDVALGVYEGVSPASKDGKYGFVDMEGKEVITPQYDDANGFYNDIALVGKNGEYFFIDKNGNKVSNETWNFETTTIYTDHQDIVFYKQDSKWGVAKITY